MPTGITNKTINPMAKIIIGIFIILHGLVHLLYFGQSKKSFELRPGMIWPDDSWLFSKKLGIERTRVFASILCILVAIGFILSGIGLLFIQPWWQKTAVVSIIVSSLIYILFWDGRLHKLNDQGGYAIIINSAILIAMFIIE
jgi:hypothetical protein